MIDPAKGETDRLLRQVEQLSTLVEDLRTLAHADAGELELERTPIDLGDVLRAAVADRLAVIGERDEFERERIAAGIREKSP